MSELIPETSVNEVARFDLLVMLKTLGEYFDRQRLKSMMKGEPDYWPKFFPLFVDEWPHSDDDIKTAAREAAVLGQIELHVGTWMAKITPQGADIAEAYLARQQNVDASV